MIISSVAWAIVLDCVTGIIAERATGHVISSRKGMKGFWKKLMLLAALSFGFFMDVFIPYCMMQLQLDIHMQNAMFGMVIGCYIVLNESISICENIYRANPEIMPKWIKHMLVATRKQIDMGEKKEISRKILAYNKANGEALEGLNRRRKAEKSYLINR